MQAKLIPLIGCVILSSLLTAQQSPSPAEQTPAEQALLQSANQRRAEQGIAPLAWDAALAKAAKLHASRMMREHGSLEHQYLNEPDVTTRAAHAGAHFSIVSENIAAGGPNAAAIANKWMSTEVHRTNTLNPTFNVVGIGVVEDHGTLYAVEDFARSVPVLDQNDIERQAQHLLLEQGIKPALAARQKEDARINCALTTGTAGHPLLVIHWEGPDLTQLPTTVLQQMPSARSHTVAIASCPTQQPNQGFTTYRLAILIY